MIARIIAWFRRPKFVYGPMDDQEYDPTTNSPRGTA